MLLVTEVLRVLGGYLNQCLESTAEQAGDAEQDDSWASKHYQLTTVSGVLVGSFDRVL